MEQTVPPSKLRKRNDTAAEQPYRCRHGHGGHLSCPLQRKASTGQNNCPYNRQRGEIEVKRIGPCNIERVRRVIE